MKTTGRGLDVEQDQHSPAGATPTTSQGRSKKTRGQDRRHPRKRCLLRLPVTWSPAAMRCPRPKAARTSLRKPPSCILAGVSTVLARPDPRLLWTERVLVPLPAPGIHRDIQCIKARRTTPGLPVYETGVLLVPSSTLVLASRQSWIVDATQQDALHHTPEGINGAPSSWEREFRRHRPTLHRRHPTRLRARLPPFPRRLGTRP